MASNETAALVVALSAQLTKFEKDMKGAVDIASKRTKEIEGHFAAANREIGNQLTGIAGNLGAVGSVMQRLGPVGIASAVGAGLLTAALMAMSRAANKLGDDATKLQNLADVTGLTTIELQALADVGARFAIEEEKMGAALGRFTAQLSDLRNGEGELAKVLRSIDAGLLRQIAAAKTESEALNLLAQAYLKAGSAAKEAELSAAAFGRRGGLQIGLLLKDMVAGGGTIKSLVRDFRASGDAIDDDVIKKIRQLRTEIKDMSDDAQRNFASIFTVSFLEKQRQYTAEWLGLSRTAKNFELSPGLKRMIDFALFPHTIGVSLGNVFGDALTGEIRPEVIEAKRKEQERLTAELERYNLLFEATSNRHEQTRLSLVWESTARALKAVNDELDKLAPKSNFIEAAVAGGANVLLPRRRPDEAGAGTDTNTRKFQFNEFKREIEVLGEAATMTQRYELEKKKLAAAAEESGVSQDVATRALAAWVVKQNEQILSARIALGVAQESEIVSVRTAAIDLQVAQGKLTLAERTRALAMSAKEAKEQFEQLQVKMSNLPQLKQLELDAQNLRKGLDGLAVNSLNSLENSLADVITRTKSVSDAFRDMAQAILRDMAKLVIRQSITGPLAGLLGAALGGAVGGGFTIPKFAGGGVMDRDGPAMLHANEVIFTPSQIRALNRDVVARSSAVSGVNVQVQNYGTNVVVDRISPNDVRVIATQVAEDRIRERTPSLISREIANPNSRVSTSIGRNIQAPRRR